MDPSPYTPAQIEELVRKLSEAASRRRDELFWLSTIKEKEDIYMTMDKPYAGLKITFPLGFTPKMREDPEVDAAITKLNALVKSAMIRSGVWVFTQEYPLAEDTEVLKIEEESRDGNP